MRDSTHRIGAVAALEGSVGHAKPGPEPHLIDCTPQKTFLPCRPLRLVILFQRLPSLPHLPPACGGDFTAFVAGDARRQPRPAISQGVISRRSAG